jgi:leucyl aminopeptidase
LASITSSAETAVSLAGEALVVGLAKGPKGPVLVGPPASALRKLARTVVALGGTGALEEVVRVPAPDSVAAQVVVAVGLGEQQRRYDAQTLRDAAGAAARSLAGHTKVVLALPVTDAAELEAVATGALLGAYTFTEFRARTAGDGRAGVKSFVLAADLPAKDTRMQLARARAVAEAITLTRDLVNTPANRLSPAVFADRAVRQGRAAGLAVRVLDEKALRAGGYGGIMGVGQGSANPPRLVRVEYRHPRASKHIALVGKGITFDSGGLSIKNALNMQTMKCDMAGAAAVLSALLAVARLKPAANVTGWLPLAENMPGGGAQRPSDVLVTYGGRTVEVLNTDAEGRLVLADALVAAAEGSPDVIVDVATLTGAARVALGARTAAVMANDDDLRAKVHDAAQRVGEAIWPMPLPGELRRGLDSAVADIANVSNARLGGALVGALFLAEFVDPGTPWAHIDMAGPAFNDGPAHGCTPKGGTGFAVRTLVQLVEDLAAGRL